MRDLASDWRRWTGAERVGAITLAVSLILLPGSSAVLALIG